MNATVGQQSVWSCECYSTTSASVESVVLGCECYSRTMAGVDSVVWGCECCSRTTAIWALACLLAYSLSVMLSKDILCVEDLLQQIIAYCVQIMLWSY